MNALKSLAGLIAAAYLATAWTSASAQTQPASPAADARAVASPVIYVGDFQASLPTAQDESGLFARKHAARDDKKIGENAQALPDAIVKALREKGVAAYRLNPGQSMPASGWLVDGSYQQTISHAPFQMIAALAQPSKPNTDASIRIVDLGGRYARSPAGFTASTTLKGQGSSFSTNPYTLAAKIVIHRAEADSSMDALANTIADRIVATGRQANAGPSTAFASVSRLP